MHTTTTTYELKSLLSLVYASTSKWASLLTMLPKGTQIEVLSIYIYPIVFLDILVK